MWDEAVKVGSDLMADEEDIKEEGQTLRRTSLWRSDDLNEVIDKLEGHIEEDGRRDSCFIRVKGLPSERARPKKMKADTDLIRREITAPENDTTKRKVFKVGLLSLQDRWGAYMPPSVYHSLLFISAPTYIKFSDFS